MNETDQYSPDDLGRLREEADAEDGLWLMGGRSTSTRRLEESYGVGVDSIERNQTWDLVPRLTNTKVVGVKWVFKTKYRNDGTLDKHKARLVTKGYSQSPGLDYDDTFAPTARMTTIRTVFALAST